MANPKGNPQNLKPFKSAEEAKKKGRKGGKKSQQVQRERRKAKECMEMILSLDVKGKKAREMMSKLGIESKEQKNIMLLMTSMFTKAVSSGDANTIKSILELVGDTEVKQAVEESPTINITVSAATADDMDREDSD